ncbi:hypothetical protein BC332_17125 [Capsicum chinense]|nr:hypothetical protein BC332_17125 [Capsicum chinense]
MNNVYHFLVQVQDLVYGGYFTELRNTSTIEQPTNHLHGNTQLTRYNTYCMRCNVLLGWQIVASIPQSEYFVAGRFFMILDLLKFQNHLVLRRFVQAAINQLAPNEEDVGANGQDEGVDEQVPNEQDEDANEQNHDQDGGSPNEQNADQDGGASDQDGDVVPDEEDVGANEQVGGANGQDGGVNELVPNEEDAGANDQDEGVNEQFPNEQDEDANEQNHDQDGGAPAKRRKM